MNAKNEVLVEDPDGGIKGRVRTVYTTVTEKVSGVQEKVSNIHVDPAELMEGIIRQAVAIPGIAIDRDKWLEKELKVYCPQSVIDEAVATSPFEVGVPQEIMDKIATKAIRFETSKASSISFAAGLPGGFALLATIPTDMAQYYAHIIRIEQKLAYAYGWGSFLKPGDEVDDQTMGILIALLGVAEGVGTAGMSLSKFAASTVQKSVVKNIQKQALTRTSYYPAIKKILQALGVKVNKEVFAKGVGKVVPVVGGVVSGGLTMTTFTISANRLKKRLKELPAAGAAYEYEGDSGELDEDTPAH